MARPLVIGVGEEGVTALPARLLDRLAAMDLVVAAPRFQAGIPAGPEIIDWPSPFADVYGLLKSQAGASVALLTTGDPMWYGAGASLVRELGPQGCEVVPGVSGLQLAAARLGWPLAGCEIVTVHGRPHAGLVTKLFPRARILVIAQDGSTPARLAEILCQRGYGAASLHVLAHLGGENERRIDRTAESWRDDTVPDFHIVGISCPDDVAASSVLAAADADFETDGKMTKRDVRASALVKLAPFPGAVLWDIGAGSGAVSIDFLRVAAGGRAFAIDSNETQLARAVRNAQSHGVSGFEPVAGLAAECLANLPRPDAVFIGGGLATGIIDTSQAALRPGGVLVSHAVTIESESVLIAAWQRTGGDLTRLSIQHADPIGGFHGWRPLMPVTQWCWRNKERDS